MKTNPQINNKYPITVKISKSTFSIINKFTISIFSCRTYINNEDSYQNNYAST